MNHQYSSFKLHFPYIEEDVVEYHQLKTGELIIHLDDGVTIMYDDLDNTIRVLPEDPSKLSRYEFAREFGLRFRRMASYKGVTQFDLVILTGIQQSLLSDYMNGKKVPSFYNVDKIARALDCSVEEFRYTE